MRTRTMWLLAAASMLLVSAACASSPQFFPTPLPTVLPTVEPSPTPQNIDAIDPTDCEVHIWHSFSGEEETALLSIAGQFEAENLQQIRVRAEFHNPLRQELLTAVASGTPPDIVIAPCDEIADYALAGTVVSLGDYVSSARLGLSKAELADLWPTTLQHTCPTSGERIPLGLRFDCHMAVMYYHAGWLKKLKYKAPPQTWEEFKKLCTAARDRKAGTWGYAHAINGLTLGNWIAGLGGTLIDARCRQSLLDRPEAIAALTWLQDALQDGLAYCAPEAGGDRADFASEKVLFTFGSTADLREYSRAILNAKTKKPRFEWSIAPIPRATGEPTVTVEGSAMAILHTAPRQQVAAWLFLKWFLRSETDLQWTLATGSLPMHKSTAGDPKIQPLLDAIPQYAAAVQLLAYSQPEPVVPRWRDIRALLANAAEAVCRGQATPADALAAANAAANGLLPK